MTDKLIRVSEETHRRLTDLGKKGETYEEIISRLLKVNETWQEILTLCGEIKEILDSSHMYPGKSPFRTSAFQAMAHDIHKKISKIEQLTKGEA
jgi:uncharacterized protein YhaN